MLIYIWMYMHILSKRTPDFNINLTYTASPICSHYISLMARTGEGARCVFALSLALTGLQACHSGQSALVNICKAHKKHVNYDHTKEAL